MIYYIRYPQESFAVPILVSPENDYLCGSMVYLIVYPDGSEAPYFSLEPLTASDLTFSIYSDQPLDATQDPIHSQIFDVQVQGYQVDYPGNI
mmetsp:Transcript_20625/g.19614  ORF Transcript_20625/g.19614 Transcript_20625/m.19614 type:complete len:92 (+) Transcript_20625:578-853(+)